MEKRISELRVQTLLPIISVSLCFLLGAIVGCLFAASVTGEDATLLSKYLSDYIILLKGKSLEFPVFHVVWKEGRWFLVCALLGTTKFGVTVLPVLFIMRGFLFAFGSSCLVRFYGLIGFLPAGIIFVLPALFWMPGFLLFGMSRISAGIRALKNSVSDVRDISVFRSHRASTICGVVLLGICIFVECSFLPALLSLAGQSFG